MFHITIKADINIGTAVKAELVGKKLFVKTCRGKFLGFSEELTQNTITESGVSESRPLYGVAIEKLKDGHTLLHMIAPEYIKGYSGGQVKDVVAQERFVFKDGEFKEVDAA